MPLKIRNAPEFRRRRRVAAVAFLLGLAAVGYFVLNATVFAPVDKHGASFTHLEIESKAVGRELGVNVIVPRQAGPPGKRWLLVFLHGRGGNESSGNGSAFAHLPELHGRGPVFAFPDGGDHGYWHNREEGNWGDWVMDEVIPTVVRRFGIDPHRIAIGGISMGGFGALNFALQRPGRFCAVGGHSPALWLHASETAPGAFDDEEDFDRNDVLGTVEANPDAFGSTKVWVDYGETDDFHPYDESFVAAMESGNADFTHHSWPGGHEGSYWTAHWPQYQRFYVDALRDC
jgi:S-formylglutathione hydrolase FrmB